MLCSESKTQQFGHHRRDDRAGTEVERLREADEEGAQSSRWGVSERSAVGGRCTKITATTAMRYASTGASPRRSGAWVNCVAASVARQ